MAMRPTGAIPSVGLLDRCERPEEGATNDDERGAHAVRHRRPDGPGVDRRDADAIAAAWVMPRTPHVLAT